MKVIRLESPPRIPGLSFEVVEEHHDNHRAPHFNSYGIGASTYK